MTSELPSKKDQQRELLLRLKNALSDWRPLHPRNNVLDFAPRLFQLKIFTDNVVIGYPIRTRDMEAEIGHVIDMLLWFQLQMMLSGFFLRGAVTVGDLFMDDEVVFGVGLLEAYEAETKLARDPRIVLTEKARERVVRHLRYYGSACESPQYHSLLQDSDGQVFLNYLAPAIWDYEGEGYWEEAVQKHKQVLESRLQEFSANPQIWSKYFWAANYHNYFCSRFKSICKIHEIDLARFHPRPVPIVNEDQTLRP